MVVSGIDEASQKESEARFETPMIPISDGTCNPASRMALSAP
jgi:hypothetical protein